MAVRETGPQPSLESEMAVLGSLLIDPDIVRPLLAEVREEDFQSPVNREIFQTARALFRAGKPVDAITIRESLKTDYTDYLVQLMEITPTSANWREYAAILRDKATLNRAAVLGGELSVAQDLDTCRDLIAKLGQLFSGGRKLAAWTMPELLESFFQSQEPGQPPVEYISFGLDVVDKGSYIQRGDVVILGGYPSDGKTCLALQMAWHMADKHKVGFFSLETDRKKLRDRLMAHAAKLRLADIKDRTISEADWASLAETTTRFSQRDLTVIETSGMTALDIQSASQAYGFEIIFVDYVQLIIPETPRGTMRSEQMASVSRDLHTFARTSGTLVVELAQLTRKEQGQWRAPNMHDLKESGQFEQDADLIFLLYQPGPKSKLDKDSSRILTIGKNKEGRQGDWPLYFDGEKQTFTVMAGEDGRSVLQSLQAEGRKAQIRSRQDPNQVEFTELPGGDKDLPF